ncbi:hypothetical protein BDA96_03G317000 [Sorghum bicolor]|uniref:Uncharacterized protein n=2 Tax=Sorghum bicolor TaxID=4558 RepID=A0A921RGV6_SORBI|nr:hypothetical protein BDA96_03G317000 [Sorghum bicolor]OQU87528.1 hypothetical protein SORBI_3003G293550 [Sorghum bicolor]
MATTALQQSTRQLVFCRKHNYTVYPQTRQQRRQQQGLQSNARHTNMICTYTTTTTQGTVFYHAGTNAAGRITTAIDTKQCRHLGARCPGTATMLLGLHSGIVTCTEMFHRRSSSTGPSDICRSAGLGVLFINSHPSHAQSSRRLTPFPFRKQKYKHLNDRIKRTTGSPEQPITLLHI